MSASAGDPRVIERVADLPAPRGADWAAPTSRPGGVLMCPPDHFAVVDVKNPHMAAHVGAVDPELATRQWEALAEAFRSAGVRVDVVAATTGCEDMVFTANQTLTGVDAAGRPTVILSRMRHASRQREVAAFAEWFTERDWRVVDPFPSGVRCEGGGDLLWHPGRRLLWAGHGPRTVPEAHAVIADVFGVPVIRLALRARDFYHLDTALCALDERTALVHTDAFDGEGLALLHAVFDRVIDADAEEARAALACNAAAFPGGIVIDQRAVRTAAQLRELGYRVLPVDTGEFLKSGGSVFCMQQVVGWAAADGPSSEAIANGT